MRDRSGQLTVLGTGIRLGHMTLEAASFIEHADVVFFLVYDPVTEGWICKKNKNSISLRGLYEEGKNRIDTYDAMVRQVVDQVREGKNVVAAFYGHPAVFVNPSHRMVEEVRNSGLEAAMLPGISAEDCLYADMGIDPAIGVQMFEATDFLIRERSFDSSNLLILWQIGAVGEGRYIPNTPNPGLPDLQALLEREYGSDHTVTIYEAREFPFIPPLIQSFPLRELVKVETTGLSTLVIKPTHVRAINRETISRLEGSLRLNDSRSTLKAV